MQDRVRFVYARLPAVFTAERAHFQPQLDYLTGDTEDALPVSILDSHDTAYTS